MIPNYLIFDCRSQFFHFCLTQDQISRLQIFSLVLWVE